MNVLSLFDGISCGQVALKRAGIQYENYFASEIEKVAIDVTMHHFPNTVQLGDVTKIKAVDLPQIDLLIGGSPCQDLSRAKTDGEGLDGDKSGLFFEYLRLLKELKPKYFLLENVMMKQEWQDIITEALGVEPIEINSNLVSAQNRRRLYWTNIPNLSLPEDKGITIADIIYDDSYKVFTDERINKTRVLTKNYVKWDLSGKRYYSQQDRAYFKNKKSCSLTTKDMVKIVVDLDNNIYRRLHPIEAERLQTLNDNYTNCGASTGKRMAMIGNGWTVDIIAHIFKGII